MDDLSVLVASVCHDDLACFEVVLRDTGWRFLCAHSAADAVAFVRAQRPSWWFPSLTSPAAVGNNCYRG